MYRRGQSDDQECKIPLDGSPGCDPSGARVLRCQTSTTTFFALVPLSWIADTEKGGSSSVISAFGMVSSMFDSGTSGYSKLSTDLLSKPDDSCEIGVVSDAICFGYCANSLSCSCAISTHR